MRRLLFALALTVALMVQLTSASLATGPGGWDHLGNGGSPTLSALNGPVYAL